MSRKYQGRHRALPVSPLQSARVALPALAAASLTVAAAGTAAATGVGSQTRASASAGFKDTTQWDRQSTAGISRSTHRSSVVKAKATASAKAKNRAAAAKKAKLARDGQARRAVLGALSSNDSSARSYSQPQQTAPEVRQGADAGSKNAVSARGSQERRTSVARSTLRKAPERSSRSGSERASRSSTRRAVSTAAPSSSSGWVRPISGASFTSGFGYRWGRLHAGVDFAAPSGTPLRAMNDAVVVASGWYGGQGKRLVLRFANGTEAHYAHMSGFAASPGQRVSAGEVVGYSGNTGNSTGPHLHLEIHVGGTPINPSGWLAARGLM